MPFAHASKQRLTLCDLPRFPSGRLLDRIGRAVCVAGCLPRKELYEAWEVARRTRRLFRGGRVVDLGGGHGLLGQILLLLDDTSPMAAIVDAKLPPSCGALHAALCASWPRLAGRVEFLECRLEGFGLFAGDVVVSAHACGALTDTVLARACAARARVAVLPCCHDADTCDQGPLAGWLDRALAIDVMRAIRLEALGYRVRTQRIPDAITPKNRLLLGAPPARATPAVATD